MMCCECENSQIEMTCRKRYLLRVSLCILIGILLVASYRYTIALFNGPALFDVYGDNHLEQKNNNNFDLPHKHVYFLKTHRTGSTPLFAILADYSRSQKLLTFLPPGPHIKKRGTSQEEQLKMVDNYNLIKKPDMVFNNQIFSPSIFKYLHKNTFKVTLLREPFENFVSSFLYFRNEYQTPYLVRVPTNDPVTEFLRHPDQYETKEGDSWTNNRQSIDLGYDPSKGFNDTEYITKFIKEVDSEFDLIINTEYFDEGLVLLKRALRWNTDDIIYLIENEELFFEETETKVTNTLSEVEQRKLHSRFSKADIMLYDYFLNQFKEKMSQEEGLKEEVYELQHILIKFRSYCNRPEMFHENLFIPDGAWNTGFQLTPAKCRLHSFNSNNLTKYLQENQRAVSIH